MIQTPDAHFVMCRTEEGDHGDCCLYIDFIDR